MLVLSRRIEEVIHLQTSDGLVTIVVKSIGKSSHSVRLAIGAPESVQIFRGELLDPFLPSPSPIPAAGIAGDKVKRSIANHKCPATEKILAPEVGGEGG